MSFKVKFWGVRGSIPMPSRKHMIFGGNTSCIELGLGGHRVILDAGTGIRELGRWLERKGSRRAHLLLSHTHTDHINGFPFFGPAYARDHELVIMAGHLGGTAAACPDGAPVDLPPPEGIESVLNMLMYRPLFPVPLCDMGASIRFEDFVAGDRFELAPGIRVRTAPLNHPNGATGYRVEYGGRAFCYVTDTEHRPGAPDERILSLIEGADLVAYDCTYTDLEFADKVGWGHSTWEEGVRLCRAAGARRLAIFHHDPDHDDDAMFQIERAAKAMWPGAFVARENQRVDLLSDIVRAA